MISIGDMLLSIDEVFVFNEDAIRITVVALVCLDLTLEDNAGRLRPVPGRPNVIDESVDSFQDLPRNCF